MEKPVILVVEDEPINGEARALVLRIGGYEAVIAKDGFDALLKITEHNPDLMISDLRMPEMSGFELLSVVRRRYPEIPVIAVSGDFDPVSLPQCLICDAFLQKGRYQPEELLAKIAELLSRERRPAHSDREPVPVWIPRARGDYYIVTCTNCLRSFPVRATTREEHAEQHIFCIHCNAGLTYFIQGGGPISLIDRKSA